ncbi:MAG: hypothetical protein IH863_06285 [Chloroflexi bacterium]|nr:hypothetical protein [Chloroflexota bacterium]
MRKLATVTLTRLLPLPIVFALLFAPLQASDTAYACSCASTTILERVEQSQLVFVGTFDRLEGASPVFGVQRYYKGTGSAEVSVSDPIGGNACSYFSDGGAGGGTFLVFARDVGDGYATGLCAGNASSDSPDYNASVAEVEALTGPGVPPDDVTPQDEATEGDASTPWAVILPLAFAIPLAVLVVPAFLRRRGGH